ncbi:MAG: dienelactone hydrolase [Dehalococcoidia bacterium]|nr:dienelactone hydrolase [Dehalococcoidia bacterium]
MAKKRVTFPCGAITLEGVLDLPDGPGPHPAVVVCHPHPRMGGSMDNNVVDAACDGLGHAGIGSLCFNFRGVEGSQGSYGDGIGEQEDVAAAISFLESQLAVDSQRIGLAGYSFGSGVSAAVAPGEPRVKALALVAPSARLGEQEGSPLSGYAMPKLIMTGSFDNFAAAPGTPAFLDSLPEPKEFHLVDGADHFWNGFEMEIVEKVGRFFAKYLGKEGQG